MRDSHAGGRDVTLTGPGTLGGTCNRIGTWLVRCEHCHKLGPRARFPGVLKWYPGIVKRQGKLQVEEFLESRNPGTRYPGTRTRVPGDLPIEENAGPG
eukprot:1701124-Rhodomonas_salina.1